MGGHGTRRYDDPVRRYFTPRCLGMHVTLLVLLPTFALLTRWQLGRALDGNTLSWAYTFEWPLFAGYAIYVWWQLVHDQHVPGASRPAKAAPAGAEGDPSQPGWALTGGRGKNVAVAASAPIDEEEGGRGERFRPQTEQEAAELAEYNRYLAALAEVDAADARRR
jgi:hypothetical protein